MEVVIFLTPRQQKFAWLLGEGALTQVDAYIKTGFSPGSARQNATHLAHQSRVAEAIGRNRGRIRTVALEQTGLSKAWILEKLQKISGEFLSAEHCNPTAAIRALELLGKEIGMFVARRDVTPSGVDAMSREELLALKADLAQWCRELGADPAALDQPH